jgi:hypothetical protein
LKPWLCPDSALYYLLPAIVSQIPCILFEGVTPLGSLEPFPVAGAICAPGRSLAVSASSCCLCAALLLQLPLLDFPELVAFTRAQDALASHPDCVPLQDDCSGVVAGSRRIAIVYLPLLVSPLVGDFCSTDDSRQGETQEK